MRWKEIEETDRKRTVQDHNVKLTDHRVIRWQMFLLYL